MKIEVGKTYRTRDGRKATITATDVGKPPLVFYGSVDGVLIDKWFPDGRYLPNGLMCFHDLVAEWEETTMRRTSEGLIVEKIEVDPLLETAQVFDELPASHKYASTNREEDLTIFHSEQATTVFRWFDPCDSVGPPPVLQQKFIIWTRKNAGDAPMKTIEWRVIPTVSV
jgi:hypothetical protein